MPIFDSNSERISEEATANLPDDVRALEEAQQIKQQMLIDALGESVKTKRDEAVKYRAASGIETQWLEDEEFYEGIDDANRSEGRPMKPMHPSGVVSNVKIKNANKSSIFYNITRQYVDSAAASISEMGAPTDDRSFSIEPSNIPELDAHKNNPTPANGTDAQGQPVQATVGDFAKQEIAIASKAAKAAQDEIDDHLVACQWHAQQREAIHDAAKIGTCVLKGPFPFVKRHKKTVQGNDGQVALVVEIKTDPISKCISVWNCFPDPTCGEDIQNGGYFLELDHANGRQLMDFKKLPGYLPDQIDKVIKEGPKKGSVIKQTSDTPSAEKYEIWYYYGMLTRDEIKALKIDRNLDTKDAADSKALQRINELEACPCIVTLANDTVIKAALNPLDSGEYPYDFWVWERIDGMPYGNGISRIMRSAQRVVNGGIRNMMDNAKLSGGVQIGFKKGKIKPMGSSDWSLNSVTFWEMDDEDGLGINEAISFTQIPSLQKELMNIIQFGQKMAEDVTGMPLLMQGQQGSAPDTVGGMQMLNKNATATRRMKARSVDDDLTTPHIRRYYEWILMYGSEEAKGDFNIKAKGSQALVERDIERQYSIQMLANALQPQYGIDPYIAMSNALRAEMIDPSSWQIPEEEYQQKMQAMSQQSQNPAIQAAQIRADAQLKAEQMREKTMERTAQIHAQGAVQSTQLRTERDAAYDEIEKQKLVVEENYKMKQLEIQREIALLNYANQRNINIDNVKSELAQTTMKLNTEKELAAQSLQMQTAMKNSEHLDSAITRGHEHRLNEANNAHALKIASLAPEVQVPGKAADGQSLSQVPPVGK